MHSSEIERQQRVVDQLSNAMGKLGEAISAQGIGVSEKLDHALRSGSDLHTGLIV